MNKVFNLDLEKLAILLLPIALRKATIIALTKAFVAPLTSLYDVFIFNRNRNIYKLEHNGQMCYLRAALNEDFDVDQRRIKIIDGNSYERVYIYTRGEKDPKKLGKLKLFSRSDYADTGVDFIVKVPRETYDKPGMEALINYYKLAGKRYKIEINNTL